MSTGGSVTVVLTGRQGFIDRLAYGHRLNALLVHLHPYRVMVCMRYIIMAVDVSSRLPQKYHPRGLRGNALERKQVDPEPLYAVSAY